MDTEEKKILLEGMLSFDAYSDRKKADVALQKYADYLSLLAKWNKAHNLTAIVNTKEMIIKHIFDCLAIVSRVTGPNVIDVGTGAGLPGIVMAIALPQYRFVLLDSNIKKISFLKAVKMQLGIDNIEIVHARVESYQPERLFSCVTSRAFCSLRDMVDSTVHLLEADGRLLAMKGKMPTEELEQLTDLGVSFEVQPLAVPMLPEERHCVMMAIQQQE